MFFHELYTTAFPIFLANTKSLLEHYQNFDQDSFIEYFTNNKFKDNTNLFTSIFFEDERSKNLQKYKIIPNVEIDRNFIVRSTYMSTNKISKKCSIFIAMSHRDISKDTLVLLYQYTDGEIIFFTGYDNSIINKESGDIEFWENYSNSDIIERNLRSNIIPENHNGDSNEILSILRQ